jgi:hypothetical protein
MVRNIAGTLLEIGRGKFPPGSMHKILHSKNRKLAGPTLPPGGLVALLDPQRSSMQPGETILLNTARQGAEALLAAIASGDRVRASEAAARLAAWAAG